MKMSKKENIEKECENRKISTKSFDIAALQKPPCT
jgi:hypothetical protein